MATKIVTKNSSTASAVPTASDLVQGELAVNVADKRLFTEDNAGAIVELGTNPSGNVTFQDNGKAIFGAGSDLQIYHDGSNSYISEGGDGELLLRTNGAGIRLQKNNGENMLKALTDGAVQLYYDNQDKLATTSTGIDVTGTATMDGLTVDGSATAKSLVLGSPDYVGDYDTGVFRQINIGEGGNVATFFGQDNGSAGGIISNAVFNASNQTIYGNSTDGVSRLYLSNGTFGFSNVSSGTAGAAATLIDRLNIASNGDISFYEDTGTTPKFFWDASAESLGIGTSSPSQKLHVAGNIVLNAAGFVGFGGGTNYIEGSATNLLKFGTANVERMRIDSAGNVGIATTDPKSSLEVKGTFGAPATSGSAAGFISRFSQSSGVGSLDFGFGDPYSWIQSRASNNYGINFDLALQPNGGNVGIGTSSPSRKVSVFDSVDAYNLELSQTGAYNSGKQSGIVFSAKYNSGGSVTDLASIRGGKENTTDGNFGGKLAFYTRANGGADTERMRIDSSGQLLLGRGANVASGAEATRIQFYNTLSTYDIASIRSLVGAGQVNRGELSFAVNNGAAQQERMRLDYSGNLLVGKTVPNNGVVGIEASASSFNVTVSGDTVSRLNRLSSDGEILRFQKDTATVGSIGALGANAYINSQGGTLKISTAGTERYNFDLDQIYPSVDNDTNLGLSNYRFKDLYLSGGVYLGGTGAANRLDDYEEGTHAATLNMTSGSVGYGSTVGTYVKVGNQVTYTAWISIASVSSPSGALNITLPFAIPATTTRPASMFVANNMTSVTGNVGGWINPNTATLYLVAVNGGDMASLIGENLAVSAELYITITYNI